VAQALVIHILLMSLFAVQHRRDGAQPFKRCGRDSSGHDRAQHIRAVGQLVLILCSGSWHSDAADRLGDHRPADRRGG